MEIKKIKIGIFITTGLEYGGGFEKYLIKSAQQLMRFDNVEIDILSMDETFMDRIVKISQLYFFKKIDRRIYRKESTEGIYRALYPAQYVRCHSFNELRKKLRQYDIIYSKNEILEAVILKSFVGYRKIPPVVFSCGTPLHYPVAQSLSSMVHNYIYSGFVYKYFASGVTAFHVKNSDDEKNVRILFRNKKVAKIFNAVDQDELVCKDERVVRGTTFDEQKINIVWVGRLTEQKGVDDLIKILTEINKQYKNNIVWHIFGDGEDSNKIETCIEHEKNVRHYGHVNHDVILSALDQANVFISTSKWESFGQNILEAQLKGVWSISYNISGPNEIIIHNKTGYLVNSLEEFIQAIYKTIDKAPAIDKSSVDLMRLQFSSPKTYGDILHFIKDNLK